MHNIHGRVGGLRGVGLSKKKPEVRESGSQGVREVSQRGAQENQFSDG